MKKCILFLLLSSALLYGDFGIQPQMEIHGKYQNLDLHLQDVVIYGRIEGVCHLPQNWQLYTRLDIPYLWLWGKKIQFISIDEDGIVSITEEKEGSQKIKTPFRERGLGDILTRAFFVSPLIGDRTSIGFGSELTFPTAQQHDLGTGKYSARPMIGFKCDLPEIGEGSFAGFLGKYQFSFAGSKHRASFQILSLQPLFVYMFAPSWTLALTPEYQLNIRTQKWFIPIQGCVTKAFTDHFSVTLAYQKGVVTDFPVFQQEVEFTIRYTF